MTITEIPKAYEYACDAEGCTATHRQESLSGGGHYYESTPPGWTSVRLWLASVEANPFHIEKLYCPVHGTMLVEALP